MVLFIINMGRFYNVKGALLCAAHFAYSLFVLARCFPGSDPPLQQPLLLHIAESV